MDTITFLRQHIDARRLFHALIVTGADAEERMTAARYLAKAAVCERGGRTPCGVCRHCVKADKGIHPDITVVEREKDAKELTIDKLRAVRASSVVMPNEAEKSVYILSDADTMNAPAQNAMLKVFEEPPAHAVFLLVCENPERLLATVRSRCESVVLPPKDDFTVPPAAEELVALAARGDSAGIVRATAALEKLGRLELADVIAGLRVAAVRAYGAGALSDERFTAVAGAAETAEKYMAVNVSAGYIAGVLMAALV